MDKLFTNTIVINRNGSRQRLIHKNDTFINSIIKALKTAKKQVIDYLFSVNQLEELIDKADFQIGYAIKDNIIEVWRAN